jgi:hypothetical protein
VVDLEIKQTLKTKKFGEPKEVTHISKASWVEKEW